MKTGPFGAIEVPVIGAELEAFECVVLVSMRCTCRDGNRPMLLKGHEQAAVCGYCGRVFAIVAVRFDRRSQRPPEAQVACVGRQETQAAPLVSFDGTVVNH
jgi:hypothetical protein